MGYRCVVLVLCLCVLLCPGIASAGTVTLVDETLSYVAASGESNRLVAFAEEEGIRITDTTAPVAVGQGCAAIAPGEAFCARSPDSKISFKILVGDMNDVVRVTAVYFGGRARIDGGDGDDDLKGGLGLNILDGGAGADTFRGGDCRDIVDYSSRTNPVFVTIGDSLANDGEAGENDIIRRDVGGVRGGLGNDTISFPGAVATCADVDLSGGDGNDVLTARSFASLLRGGRGNDELTAPVEESHMKGGPGDDVVVGGDAFQLLDGGEGRDHLFGRGGADRLVGGAGSDRLIGGDGAHDRLRGGAGSDTLLSRDDKPDKVDGGDGHDRARVDRIDHIESIEEFF